MAKKTVSNPKIDETKKAKWQGFVNVYLGVAEKKKVKDFTLTDAQLLDFMTDVTELGYKLSVTWSRKGEFFTVTCYGQYEDGPNAGVAMSLRHRSLEVAITALNHCLEEAGMASDWSERYTSVSGHDW